MRFHRRDFLRVGTAGLAGLGLADLLRLEAHARAPARKPARSVILVWLSGGPSTIDMWDLKPDAPAGVRGEFKPIPTSAKGVQIGEHLPKLAKQMHRAALVRSLAHSIPEHNVGTVYMTSGNAPAPALVYPSLGSLTARTLPAPEGLPSYVVLPGSGQGRAAQAGFLGPAYNPFEVTGDAVRGSLRLEGMGLPSGFSESDLNDRSALRDRFDARFKALDRDELPASLDRFGQKALDILRSDRTRKAFDLDREPAAARDRYGRTPLGQGLLVARRLVEAGVRFVTAGFGGWDTHGDNFRTLQTRLLPPLDQGLAALLADLDERGLLETTVVYCAGEFGRTPLINPTAGRDHWPRSMAVLLAGGPVRRGFVYGSTDREGLAPATDPCSPDDVSATLLSCLGVGPTHEVQTPSGRPLAIFRAGKVLDRVLQ